MSRFIRVSLLCLLLVPVYGCGSSTPEDALREADAFLAEGDPRSAMIELKNTLQDNPDSGAARARLGDVHMMVGDYPSALKEYERALDLGVDTEPLRLSILKVKNRLGRFTEVIGELDDRNDLTPATAVLLGEALLAAGDLDRAEPYLRQGSELAAGAIGLAQISAARGDSNAALVEAGRAVGLDDVALETVLAKGELELRYELFDDAIETFQRAASMPVGQVPGILGVARARLGKKDLDGALGEVDSILRAVPGALYPQFLKAAILVEKKDFAGAEDAIREVQKVAPDHTPTMYLMALVKQNQGQNSQAQDMIRRFLAREPNDPQGLKLLGAMLGDEGRFQELVDLLTPVADSATDPQLLSMLGNAQLRLGRATEATATLQRAVQINPDALPVRNQLAISMVADGNASAAEELLAESLEGNDQEIENDFLLAMLRIQKQDAVGAMQIVDRLLVSNPELPLPYHLRGVVLLLDKKLDKAEADFRLALEKDRSFLPAAQAIAQLAQQRGDVDAAKSALAEVLVASPDNLLALLANAEFASRAGDLEATETLLKRAAEKNPKALQPLIILARLYTTQGRGEDAARMLQEGLKIDPRQIDLLMLSADLALARGDREVAVSSVEKVQEQLAAEVDNAGLLGAVGSLQLRLGQLEKARQNLEQSLALAEGRNPGALLNLARLHLTESDAALARSRLDALTELGAKGTEVDLLSADVLRAEGDLSGAVRLLGELIKQGSRDAVGLQTTAYLESGKRQEAAATLESWLKDHPDDFAVKLSLADIYMGTEPEKAIELYEQMTSTENVLVLNNLAWLYQQKGDARAIEVARQAVQSAPDNADVLDTLGWILIENGAAEEGVMHIRRSVQLKPNDATLLYHLGVGLARTGVKTEARNVLERALAIGQFADEAAAREALDALDE